MKYAFYPGCTLESSAWDLDRSTRTLCEALEVELQEIPDWVCCGSTAAHASDAGLAVALPTINLQKARVIGAPVLTACASCYSRLRAANYSCRNQPAERKRVERITGVPYTGEVEVHHVLDVLLNHVGVEKIRARLKRPLNGLRVACYYGCLLTRPPKVVTFDDPEHPTSMDALLAAVGAEAVQWPYKTECCGAGLSATHTGVVWRLGHRILSMARDAGAECLAVACPMCQLNLDLRQRDAIKARGRLPETPVLYVTQLLGLALGLPEEALGLSALTIPPQAALRRRGLSPTAGGREAP